MQVNTFEIPGLVELIPRVFGDDRGYFFESYNQEAYSNAGVPTVFLQDNQSFSKAGTIRGMHFQAPPFAQAKLVRVIQGEALDIVVDIRKGSPTYGKWAGVVLSAEKQNSLYIPEGFAHGFQALSDCIFFYKCSKVYNKSSEGGILFNDADLALPWSASLEPLVSDKDEILPKLAHFDSPFTF